MTVNLPSDITKYSNTRASDYLLAISWGKQVTFRRDEVCFVQDEH